MHGPIRRRACQAGEDVDIGSRNIDLSTASTGASSRGKDRIYNQTDAGVDDKPSCVDRKLRNGSAVVGGERRKIAVAGGQRDLRFFVDDRLRLDFEQTNLRL